MVLLAASGLIGTAFGFGVPAGISLVGGYFPARRDRAILYLNGMVAFGPGIAPVLAATRGEPRRLVAHAAPVRRHPRDRRPRRGEASVRAAGGWAFPHDRAAERSTVAPARPAAAVLALLRVQPPVWHRPDPQRELGRAVHEPGHRRDGCPGRPRPDDLLGRARGGAHRLRLARPRRAGDDVLPGPALRRVRRLRAIGAHARRRRRPCALRLCPHRPWMLGALAA